MSPDPIEPDLPAAPSKSSVTGVLVALVATAFLIAAGNVSILLFVEGVESRTSGLTALNSILVPLLLGLLAFLSKQTHDSVNSRMDKYEKLVEALAHAEGKVEGREERTAEDTGPAGPAGPAGPRGLRGPRGS